jgi:chemotaxis response regulator CheB
MTQTLTEKALAEVMAARIDAVPAGEPMPTSRRTMETPPALTRPTNRFILIGASTGGVDALLQILGDFPKDCPPTAIVNRPGFTGGQNSRRIAHYGTVTQQEDLEAVYT